MLARENWCARGVRERAIREPLRPRKPDSTAAFRKRCATMRSNRPSVAAAARKSHARVHHARARKV
eukprot:4548496-Lingulodinium_polyedra.AAC.1